MLGEFGFSSEEAIKVLSEMYRQSKEKNRDEETKEKIAFIGKSILTKHGIDEMFRTKPAHQGCVYTIPLFYYSIIPCVG